MRIYLKLGGSLITDKNSPRSADLAVIQRLSEEIATAVQRLPDLELILGHGSGSFGHVPAKTYGTRQGVRSPAQWQGFVDVWRQARDLNEIVLQALYQAGLPVMSFPPSAILQASDGQPADVYTKNIKSALQHRLIPVVYGDVIFDEIRGGTIFSTEDVFVALSQTFPPDRILLCGQEAGVWEDFPACSNLLKKISKNDYAQIKQGLHGSAGIDITGGMEEKVRLMISLTEQFPQLSAVIFSGIQAGNLEKALCGEEIGTVIWRSQEV